MVVRLLRIFAIVWSTPVALFWLGNLALTWYYEGFGKIQGLLSPFNVLYYLFGIATNSPAIGGYMLADRLKARRHYAKHEPTA